MTNKFSDMRDILMCYGDAQDEELGTVGFAAKVQTLMGLSVSRKIQALCYLFDNLLQTNADLVTALQEHFEMETPVTTKEDAFTALQMAITYQAANYQNGTNE